MLKQMKEKVGNHAFFDERMWLDDNFDYVFEDRCGSSNYKSLK